MTRNRTTYNIQATNIYEKNDNSITFLPRIDPYKRKIILKRILKGNSCF